MKKLTLLLPLLLLAGCTNTPSQTNVEIPRDISNIETVACTEEAKLCPDGTAVGRTGPNCEFAPCPTTSTGGTTAQNSYSCGITPDANCGTGK